MQVLLRRSVFLAALLAVSATACVAVGPTSSAMAQQETAAPASKLACRTRCPGGRPPEIKDAGNSCSETTSDRAFYCRNAAGKLTFCDCVYQRSEPEETEGYEEKPDARSAPAANGED